MNMQTKTRPPLIDLIIAGTEEPLDARQALALDGMRKYGKAASKSNVIYRLAKKGVRGVKLQTALVGGNVVTTKEAVARFLIATNDARERSAKSSIFTPRQVTAATNRINRQATAYLDAAGL